MKYSLIVHRLQFARNDLIIVKKENIFDIRTTAEKFNSKNWERH